MDFSTYKTEEIIEHLKAINLIKPYDVMIAGVTGTGKSSTINALLNRDVAKVGLGAEPETKAVQDYALGQFIRLWDTPGLGDGTEQDKANTQDISNLLSRLYLAWNRHYKNNGDQVAVNSCETIRSILKKENYGELRWRNAAFENLEKMLDCAIIVIDGSSKDLGMAYNLLETIKAGINPTKILIAINQADIAMKGRGWNIETMAPGEELLAFLQEQALSIQRRILKTCELQVAVPTFYSAAYGYNVDKLMDFIVDNMNPKKNETDETDETQVVPPN
ncbi:MAG: 50S ribosome-binding GTPase [Defluviitaleaceae bacterium]|nr:50S ribosome-binding GTPase [Defluviitaleaceae bacterium]